MTGQQAQPDCACCCDFCEDGRRIGWFQHCRINGTGCLIPAPGNARPMN